MNDLEDMGPDLRWIFDSVAAKLPPGAGIVVDSTETVKNPFWPVFDMAAVPALAALDRATIVRRPRTEPAHDIPVVVEPSMPEGHIVVYPAIIDQEDDESRVDALLRAYREGKVAVVRNIGQEPQKPEGE